MGEAFARALAAKDGAALRAVLADPIDFAALTPGRHWPAAAPDEVVNEIILGKWFGPGDEIVSGSSRSAATRCRAGSTCATGCGYAGTARITWSSSRPTTTRRLAQGAGSRLTGYACSALATSDSTRRANFAVASSINPWLAAYKLASARFAVPVFA